MEDAWLYIEDDDSHHSASDSDIIDSETEAELYSTIHYEENLNSHKPESGNSLTSKLFVQNSSSSIFFTPNKDNFCMEEKSENVKAQLIDTFKSISNDHDSYLERNKKSPDRNGCLNKLKNLNPAKKHKVDFEQKEQNVNLCSDSSKNRDLNESSRHKSSNHVQNETSDQNSSVKQSCQQQNNAVRVYSSDSDDNIWTEMDSAEKSDFKTNLLKDVDTVYLSSSDSDGESLVSSSFKERQTFLKNISMPNIKMGEKYEGLWHINDEDLYRQRKYSRRYHENFDVTCSNCDKKGHTFRTCSVPKVIKCFICGGAHLGSRCMNRICGNCYSYGHDRRRCQMRRNNFFCTLCNLKGHIKENCPDLWRRYHLTTEPVKIVPGKRIKQDTNLYCWNCGDRGHFGGVCHARVSRNLTTWPCVVSYDDPGELLRKRLDGIKNRHGHFKRNERLKNRDVSERKDVHLKQRNKMNTSDDLSEEREDRNKRKRRKPYTSRRTMDMRFEKVLKILREHDFPRTPKQENPKQEVPKQSEMPESVELSIKQQLRNRRRNLKRRFKRRQKKSEANAQSSQAVM